MTQEQNYLASSMIRCEPEILKPIPNDDIINLVDKSKLLTNSFMSFQNIVYLYCNSFMSFENIVYLYCSL